MLVLLAIATLAAALLPVPEPRRAATTGPRDARADRPREPRRPTDTGMLLVARMRIGEDGPKTVRIETGDQLQLSVAAPFGADLEISGLGLTGVVTPSAPARFDVFATRPGAYPVRAIDPPALAGHLLVGDDEGRRCGVATPATPQGRASAPSCAPRGARASRGRGRSAPRP